MCAGEGQQPRKIMDHNIKLMGMGWSSEGTKDTP